MGCRGQWRRRFVAFDVARPGPDQAADGAIAMTAVGASSWAVATGAPVAPSRSGARWRAVVVTGRRRPRWADDRTDVDAAWRMKSPD